MSPLPTRRKQLIIPPPFRDQLRMRSTLDNPPLIQNINRIGIADRTQPVCDGDGSAAFGRPVQRLLDEGFGLRVYSRCSLIQNQNGWVPYEGAGKSQALLLAAAELIAAVADDSVETVSAVFVSGL